MSFVKISVCPQCGAPIYVPGVWHGIVPPTPTYSCFCRSDSTSSTVDTGGKIKWHYENTPTIVPAQEEKAFQPGSVDKEAIDQLEKAFGEEFEIEDNEVDTIFKKVSRIEKSVEELRDLIKAALTDKKQVLKD